MSSSITTVALQKKISVLANTIYSKIATNIVKKNRNNLNNCLIDSRIVIDKDFDVDTLIVDRIFFKERKDTSIEERLD